MRSNRKLRDLDEFIRMIFSIVVASWVVLWAIIGGFALIKDYNWLFAICLWCVTFTNFVMILKSKILSGISQIVIYFKRRQSLALDIDITARARPIQDGERKFASFYHHKDRNTTMVLIFDNIEDATLYRISE